MSTHTDGQLLAEAYPGELAMYRQLVRTLRTVVRADDADMSEVRRLLREHAADDAVARTEGKSSHTADATPGLTERQTRLLDGIRTHGGRWTTRRVVSLYALTDPDVVTRGAARRDLEALHRAGHLALVDEPDHRHYLLSTREVGA